jgi:hypothetical protein
MLVIILVMSAGLAGATAADASLLGVYFDPDNPQSYCDAQAQFSPFDIYFVLHECPFALLGGFEFAWGWQEDPPGFAALVTGVELPPVALNIGTDMNLIVGLGYGLATTEATVLAKLTILVTSPLNPHQRIFIALGPPTPASIPLHAAFNNYDNPADIRAMDFVWGYWDIPAQIEPSGWIYPGVAYLGNCWVPVEATDWGHVKALFD